MEKDKEKTNITVYQVISRTIRQLSGTLDTSAGRATLANLRNSIGKTPSETIDVWPIMFEYMPEDFLGRDGKLTVEETTVLNTLQLYALYQQGSVGSVAADQEADQWENMGTSFANLRSNDDRVSVDRRFNAMITSETYDELFYHLRQMFGLLKSRTKGQIKVNFAKLGQDIFWFILGSKDYVRIAWSREYYKNRYEDKTSSEGEENDKK